MITTLQSQGLPVPHVLVAEDDPNNALLTTTVLRLLGIEPKVVRDGSLAVREASCDRSFDLVLMDLQMPVMDGFQATKEIREHPEQQPHYLNVVALTAHVGREIRQRCLDTGFDEFLCKPLRAEHLAAILMQIALMKMKGTYSSLKPAQPPSPSGV